MHARDDLGLQGQSSTDIGERLVERGRLLLVEAGFPHGEDVVVERAPDEREVTDVPAKGDGLLCGNDSLGAPVAVVQLHTEGAEELGPTRTGGEPLDLLDGGGTAGTEGILAGGAGGGWYGGGGGAAGTQVSGTIGGGGGGSGFTPDGTGLTAGVRADNGEVTISSTAGQGCTPVPSPEADPASQILIVPRFK